MVSQPCLIDHGFTHPKDAATEIGRAFGALDVGHDANNYLVGLYSSRLLSLTR